MNEKQRITKLLKEHHKENKRDKIYYNIAYNLIFSYSFADSIKKITYIDIALLVDNLFVNNEIIDSDNINEYNTEYINKRLDKHTITKIKNNPNLFVLLNYYDISNKLIQCKKVYKYDYNILGL